MVYFGIEEFKSMNISFISTMESSIILSCDCCCSCDCCLQHMEYRRKYGADTIIEDWKPTPVMDECIAGGLFGEDREGHPVWYDNMGNLDPRGGWAVGCWVLL